MKYSEAKLGRVFVLRLEDGEIIHQIVEKFAQKKNIKSASVILLGGADKDSRIVVGPKQSRVLPIEPMEYILKDAYETAGVGTIFPNDKGEPVLHMHCVFGRGEDVKAGCIRRGVKTWYVVEAIIFEIVGSKAIRKLDSKTGFELLEPRVNFRKTELI